VCDVFRCRHIIMHVRTKSDKLESMRKISPVNLLSFYELKISDDWPFFDKNVCRPRFITPAFVRFRFVSYSHPLPTLLAEKSFHFCLQATK
jgi:hypothetical protein